MTDMPKKKSGSRKKASGTSTKQKKGSANETIRVRKMAVLTAAIIVLILLLLWQLYQQVIRQGKAVHLTDSVLQYRESVEQACLEHHIPAFSEVVLAIMQQESAGLVPDVMQASESPMNTVYPNTPGAIPDPLYSIAVGVETFAYCLNEAGCTSPRDLDRLKLALQNYNYGNEYATWALENYGGYSEENAAAFAETMKARLGWSQYGDPEYVKHVLQYYR